MAGNTQYLCTSSRDLKLFASSIWAVGVGAVAQGWPAFLNIAHLVLQILEHFKANRGIVGSWHRGIEDIKP